MSDTGVYGDEVQSVIDQILSEVNVGSPFAGLNLGATGGTKNTQAGLAALQNAALARSKFQYQQESDAQKYLRELAAQKAKTDALTKLYESGSSYDLKGALKGIADIGSTSQTGIENQLASSLAALNQGYQGTDQMLGAQQLTEQGYSALEDYLNQPMTNPYQDVKVQTPQIQNDLSALLQSQGALSPNVSAYIQGVNADMAAGAANYQNLLNTLAALETSGLQSRKREAKTAGTYAKTSLAQQKASYEGQLQAQAQQALTQLSAQMAQQRMAAEQKYAETQAALAQALAEAGIIVDPSRVGQTTDTSGDSTDTTTALERLIQAAGGTSNQSQYEQGISELSQILGGFGPGPVDFVPYK